MKKEEGLNVHNSKHIVGCFRGGGGRRKLECVGGDCTSAHALTSLAISISSDNMEHGRWRAAGARVSRSKRQQEQEAAEEQAAEEQAVEEQAVEEQAAEEQAAA